MRPRNLVTLLLSIVVLFGCSQPAGGPPTTPPPSGPPQVDYPPGLSGRIIYLAGSKGGAPGYWNNGVWNQLSAASGNASSITISGSDIYVGGGILAGYWKNGSWNGLSMLSGNSTVNETLVVSGTDVYAAGYSIDNWSTYVGGYWKNGNWTTLHDGLNQFDQSGQFDVSGGEVHCMVVYGSDVYAGGDIGLRNGQGNTYYPGYWLNGVWNGLKVSNLVTVGQVRTLAVSGSDVYAGGWIRTIGGGPDVAGYWLNGAWTQLSTTTGWVTSMTVSGSNVYAAGFCNNLSGIAIPGYWKATNWNPLSTFGCTDIVSLVLLGSDIYALGTVVDQGYFTSGYWLNGNWNAIVPANAQASSIVVTP